MRPVSIVALFAAAAVAVGASGCGNRNPYVTVTQQNLPSANVSLGPGVYTTTAPGGSAATTTATTTSTVTSQNATLVLISAAQVQLQRMYGAIHSLATANGISLHDAQTGLADVARQFDSIAHRAQMLPGSNPARAPLVHAAEVVSAAARGLQHLSVVPGRSQSQLLAVSDPVTSLRAHIGRIGRQVTSGDVAAIDTDLTNLSSAVARAGGTSSG